MEQTISFKIDVPEGKKAILKDNKIVFEDITPQLPKTWEEFCDIRRDFIFYFIDEMSYIKRSCKRRAFRNKGIDSRNKNLLPSEEDAKAHLALMQLHQLRDCYRQGWLPNNDSSDTMYNVYRYYNISAHKYSYSIFESPYMHDFLSFQSEDIATEFLNNFRKLIDQAGDLI